MKTSELGIIALTPAAWTGKDHHPGIAISALRAGAFGVVDLEYIESTTEAEETIEPVVRAGGSGGIGIRCGAEQVEKLQSVFRRLAGSELAEKLVVLCVREKAFEKKSLQQVVQTLRKLKLSVFVEVVSLPEAQIAQAAGADAVIAKGHESAGRVGEETSFVLLQRIKHELTIPVWVRGGIGLNSAAAVLAAGCAGVVLDSQLLLTRESSMSIEQKEKLSTFDGTETEIFEIGSDKFRLWVRPGDEQTRAALDEIKIAAFAGESNKKTDDQEDEKMAPLHARVRGLLVKSCRDLSSGRLPDALALGQDVAFAGTLARQYFSVNSIIAAVKKQARQNLLLAAQQEALVENSSFALAHGIKYPILQGAMTRVSDTSEFAGAVAQGGALPFLALALMRKNEIEPLLQQCREKLSGLSWGVGMLGFVPPELRQEQLQLVLKHRPPCALIAGGRPDQAKELETAGIKTYLHVPSPALLESFVEMGTRRFIFEGKECGGHVGPRSSFVLWECMIETLLNSIPPKSDPSEFNVVFAGGIHDSVSSAMVAAMAAPLVERGVKIAVLMGTAYLFTKEAVSCGAIVPKFQEAALQCRDTVLLETGPGHAIRCVESPYKQVFDDKRDKLQKSGLGKNELRQELEMMNLGRLRVASKGLARGEAGASSGSKLVKVSAEKQWADGMYMIGQVAAMHDKTTTVKELHETVSNKADKYLKSQGKAFAEVVQAQSQHSVPRKVEEPIAIVGMSCLYPKANDLETFWENIINKVDTIEEIPKEQWDASSLYSTNPLERDKIYSKWGGFLKDIPFDPSIYGIPPASLASIDPMQLLILEVTRAAIHDAGYQSRPFPKDRTSIVLANAGHGPITAFYSLRSMLDWTLSDVDPAYRRELEKRLPEWTEDSFPGYLGNVVAGRVANRFDLGGINFCVDAACASSLAALYIGIRELRAGSSDVVLLAATDTHNQPGDYLSFSKTHALSPRGRCRTFDATADGIVISEGMAVLVLKRLKDAERDGDRIYSIVRGIGGSSDGRDLSLTAPRPAGQMAALKRAYEDAGVSPATVELVEAHGTGTVAGDRAEVEALKNIFEAAGADKQVCAIGSVKTMIGHTKCAAGLASMIKVARSLYHKVLPPTIGVETPSPACNFSASPFYVNTEVRPWVHDTAKLGYPRRAGVSAFGFGGTNFHAVLEEYCEQESDRQESIIRHFPTEIFTFRSASRTQLLKTLESLAAGCKKASELQQQPHGPLPAQEPSSLFELSYKHHLSQSLLPSSTKAEARLSLAIIASSLADLLKKIEQAKEAIGNDSKKNLRDPRGIFFEEQVDSSAGKIAFLFPGQGSQQPNMLRDLSFSFACVRRTYESADSVLAGKFEQALSRYVYPFGVFSDADRQTQSQKLTDTHVAQPAVAAADMAAFKLLTSMGLKPDMCAGHSFGEYVALCASGAINEHDLFVVSEQRGSILKSANTKKSGSMTAVSANSSELRKLLAKSKDVTLANVNSPRQCIISGEVGALSEFNRVLDQQKIKYRPIAVSAAFHSPLMEPAVKQLAKAFDTVTVKKPSILVYSNTLAKEYPSKPEQIVSLLCDHLVKPVEFERQIEQMYADGARIFIECGPGSVLSGLVDDILEGKEHITLPLERAGKHGITQLQYLLAQAFAAGVELDLGKLYKHRVESLIPRLDQKAGTAKPKLKLSYLINGSHIKRFDGKTVAAANRPTEAALANASESPKPNAPERAQSSSALAQPASSSISNTPSVNPLPKSGGPLRTQPSVPSGNDGTPPLLAAGSPASIPQQTRTPRTGTGFSGNSNPTPPTSSQPAARKPGVPPLQSQPSQLPTARSARDQVMIEFQRHMLELTNSFMQAQERVMVAYLQQGRQIDPVQNQPPQLTSQEVLARVANQITNLPQMPYESKSGEAGTKSNALQSAPQISAPVRNVTSPASPLMPPQSRTASDTNNSGNNNGHSGSTLDAESLITQLIQIVSERTGYPAEMLDPTLDLEADLGIDSIKRVEILNSFRKILPEEVQTQLESGIEKLAGTKTLQGIMDWIRTDLSATAIGVTIAPALANIKPIDTATGQNGGNGGATRSNSNNGNGGRQAEALQATSRALSDHKPTKPAGIVARALVKSKKLDFLPSATPALSGLYLITDSEDGLSELVAAKLSSAGAGAIILKHEPGMCNIEEVLPENSHAVDTAAIAGKLPGPIILDLCNEDEVTRLSRKLAECGFETTGLIHLLPQGSKYQTSSLLDGIEAYAPVRSLYVLTRNILSPLAQQNKKFNLISGTALGGTFAIDTNEDFNPMLASVAGLTKTIAREFTQSQSRCIDFATGISQEQRADYILAELGHTDLALWEVGYTSTQRMTPDPQPAAVNLNSPANLDLDSSSVVLVTGGARGITAELCVELGLKHKPMFVIVGRAVRPTEPEDPAFKGLTTPRDIKAAIMDKFRREGMTLSIPAIESRYQQLMKDREIRQNLERIEATGSRVHYHSLDVRDRDAVTELIDRLYESFGKIDMVINGAGVIEDAYIKDKTLVSFDRVFGTKVDAALALASRLDFDTLKYFILFSSVVGRTGNAGQADYVAANEVMNKLAIRLNARAAGRVLSIGWGPWRGGMASDDLESVFARYGWSMIEAGDGRQSFYNELCYAPKEDAEVLLVGQLKDSNNGNGDGNGSHAAAHIRARGARLNRAEVLKQEQGQMQLRLRLDPEFDIYLKDHAFDGVPVMPMAIATELLAEAAQFMYSGLSLLKLQRLDIPSGIMFDHGPRDLFINLKELSRDGDEVTAEVYISTSATATRRNFTALAVLGNAGTKVKLPESCQVEPTFSQPEFANAEAPPTVRDVYSNWLFHGPLFQGIVAIDAMGSNGITGKLIATPIEASLKETSKEDRWLVDPLLLDSAMQLAGVWARQYMDITALPTGFRSLNFVAPPEGKMFRATIHIPTEAKNGQLLCNLALYNESGSLVMVMEDLGGVGSKALNRLGAQPKSLRGGQ